MIHLEAWYREAQMSNPPDPSTSMGPCPRCAWNSTGYCDACDREKSTCACMPKVKGLKT